jgi:flavodoxin
MKGLIVYDSYFGNTEIIANNIMLSLEEKHEVRILKADEFRIKDLDGVDFIVVGSPTRAFNTTKPITDIFKSMSKEALKGMKAAAFDTRIDPLEKNSKFLKLLMKTFGYAAIPISKLLSKKGADIIVEPLGFYVNDSEGPIRDGEIKRAQSWLKDKL